jgi:copper chaperone
MFRFNVPNMTCGGCVRSVTNAILSVDPTAEVTVDLPTREVTIATQTNEQALVTAFAKAGYRAERKGSVST